VAAIKGFCAGHPVKAGCLAVAGPVRGGEVELTNADGRLSENELARALGVPFRIVNDLVGHASGIDTYPRELMEHVQPGNEEKRAPRAILAPGTGLGEAFLLWNSSWEGYEAHPTEAGHCGFAPDNELEDRLLSELRRTLGTVSWESVLSGPGLSRLHSFVRGSGDPPPTAGKGPSRTGWRHASTADEPREITAEALSNPASSAAAACRLFLDLLASESGNLALRVMARGGVYISGNIANTLLPMLSPAIFRQIFAAKGPPNIRKILEQVPVRVVKGEDLGLFGAAALSERLINEPGSIPGG
jgi:glucokinase